LGSATEPEKGQLALAGGDAGLYDSCSSSSPFCPSPLLLLVPWHSTHCLGWGPAVQEQGRMRPRRLIQGIWQHLSHQHCWGGGCTGQAALEPHGADPPHGQTNPTQIYLLSPDPSHRHVTGNQGRCSVPKSLVSVWSVQQGNWDRDGMCPDWEKKVTAKLGKGLQTLAQQQQTVYEEQERPRCKPPRRRPSAGPERSLPCCHPHASTGDDSVTSLLPFSGGGREIRKKNPKQPAKD